MDRQNFVIAVILAALGGYGLGELSVPVSSGTLGNVEVAGLSSSSTQPALKTPEAKPPAPVLKVAEIKPKPPANPVAAQRPAPSDAPKKKTPSTPPPPPDIAKPFLGQLPRIGKADAPVVVLVVSDFQCPVCKRAAAPMKEIANELSDDLVVYFVQNPLKMHRKALPAAKASAAAHKQGKFWEYHDRLFENQRLLDEPDLASYAQQLGLDMSRFQLDSQNPQLEKEILLQRGLVESLGARGTPSFFINGRKSVGWGSKLGIKRQIEREVVAMKKLISDGKSISKAYEERVRLNSDKAQAYLSGFGR